jgi:hypothetical protein
MATTSTKGLGISNISNMLDTDQFVEKLPGSDDSQLSGHSQISDTDLHDLMLQMTTWLTTMLGVRTQAITSDKKKFLLE